MKETTSDTQFNATLAQRLQSGNGAPLMHMNAAPEGSTKSLEELVEGAYGSVKPEPASALPLTPFVPGDPAVTGTTRKIPLHLIVDSPYQPRDRYDETALQALGETLKERGQDEPIKVRLLPNGKYELIHGHRRTRAARLIGWAELEARIIVATDREAKLATLTANEGNVKLSDYERAKAYYEALVDGFAKTQKQVASLFGCSQGRVSQCLSILDLPQPFLDLLHKYPGLMHYRHAKVIKEVLAQYPDSLESAAATVEVMIDRPDMEPGELRELLTKPFAKRRVRTAPLEPRVVPDKNGKSAYKVSTRGRRITVEVQDGVDMDITSDKMLAALREFAASLVLADDKQEAHR